MIEDHEIPIIVRSGRTGATLKTTSVPAHCARVTVFLDDDATQPSVHWTLRLWAWLKNNLGLGLRQ